MTTLPGIFAQTAERYPDRVAIVDGSGREITFAALKRRADGLAAHWDKRGIRKGDRVLLAMPLDADLYASLAALWSLGATVVLPEPAMGVAGVRHAAGAAGVTAFCAAGPYRLLRFLSRDLCRARQLRLHEYDQPSRDTPTLDPDDIALISFTSGTTGTPKAIPRSHGFLMAQQAAIAPMLDSAQAERDLVAFPVFALINLARGRTSILPSWKMSRLDDLQPAQLLDWIAQQQVSRALLPPSLCSKLAGHRLPSHLHTIFTGGGPVFPDLIAKLSAPNPDLRIVCVYGSTEAEPISILDAAEISQADLLAMRDGRGLLAGQPVPDVALRIVDDEVQVAGAHVNPGYLNPADNAGNKVVEGNTIWHRTGDAGFLDDLGRLWLLGRVGTDTVVGGKRVFPFSVEVASRQWPGVRQSALTVIDDQPLLVIEGDETYEPKWRGAALALGIPQVRRIARIPMDRRHASKIDRAALRKMLT